jgi:hypothetical protein
LPPAFYSIAYRLSIDVFRNMVRWFVRLRDSDQDDISIRATKI